MMSPLVRGALIAALLLLAACAGRGVKPLPPDAGLMSRQVAREQALSTQTTWTLKGRLGVSDGHDSGIFSWDYLYFLGSQQEDLWRKYEDRLTQAGMGRDAPMVAAGGAGCGHHH